MLHSMTLLQQTSPALKHTITQPHARQILGVFDGHANLGERVSQYAVSTLPTLLATKLKQQSAATPEISDSITDDGDQHVQQALIETFVELDNTA